MNWRSQQQNGHDSANQALRLAHRPNWPHWALTGISRSGSPLTITPSARSRFYSAHCARVLSKKTADP